MGVMDPTTPSPAAQDLLAQASWIRALAKRLVSDSAEAEDLAQETLVVALCRPPAADRPLRPWLSKVLHNRIAGFARGKRGRAAREATVAREEALPSSAELAARAESQRRLVSEVLALEDPYRTLLLLRFYEGLSPMEIARRLGKPPGTVRGQLSRAIDRMRERLDAGNEDAQLDWRLACLPLFQEFAPAPTIPSATVSTLIAMHTIPKVLVGTSLLIGAFLALKQLPTNSAVDLEATPDALTNSALPEVPVVSEEPLMVARTTEEVDEESQRRQASPATQAAGALREAVQGTLTIEEPDGGSRPARAFLLQVVREEGPAELLETDATGHFQSQELHSAGNLRIVLLDHAKLDGKLYMGRSPKPLMIAEKETLNTRFQPGVAIEHTLAARREYNLKLIGPAMVVATIKQVELSSRPPQKLGGALGESLRMLAPLREGSESDAHGLWVRFAPEETGNEQWWLRVESEDGLWSAEARAPASAEFDATPIELQLVPTARIEVSVSSRAADAPEQIEVSLRPLEQAGGWQSVAQVSADDVEAIFSRGGLPAGMYRLSVRAEGTPVVKRDIELHAGALERVRVELGFAEKLHPLTLRVSSDSGQYHGTVVFMAYSAGADRAFSGQVVRWQQGEDGKWTGVQDFGQVPAGEYELLFSVMRPLRGSDLDGRTALVPGPAFEIRFEDAGEKADLALTVVDARTGEDLERPSAKLYFGDDLRGHGGGGENGSVWNDIALQSEPRWTVNAPGYLSASGDWSNYEDHDGLRQVKVALEPDGK